MKKILLLVMTMVAQIGISQNTEAFFIENQKNAYQYALKNGDIATAIISINNLVQCKGQKHYRDSLALLYQQANMPLQAGRIANVLYKEDSSKKHMLDILAYAFEATGDVENAIDSYQKIYKENANMALGYKIASLQLSADRLKESLATIRKAEKLGEIKDLVVTLPAGPKERQNVPLKAALYNLKGIINVKLDNKEGAKKSFDLALKLLPDFMAAKQNKFALSQDGQNKK